MGDRCFLFTLCRCKPDHRCQGNCFYMLELHNLFDTGINTDNRVIDVNIIKFGYFLGIRLFYVALSFFFHFGD